MPHLSNLSKRDLAAQHERLVAELMVLWGVTHRMEDWVDPLTAVQILTAEARAANGEPPTKT